MALVTGNNVSYGSGGFYDARIEYEVTTTTTTVKVAGRSYVYHSVSLYDSTNKARDAGDMKAATNYGSKTYSASSGGTKDYSTWTKTFTRGSSSTTKSQTFWVEDLADGSGGGARSTVTLTVTVPALAPTAPSKPANPTITSPGQNQATVNMVLPANNGASITSTRFELFTVASGGTAAFSYTAAPAATSRQFTGLSAGTTYYAEVRATNSAGNSPVSNRVAFTTTAASVPSKPANPTITSIGQSQATVNMVLPANNGATITSTRLQLFTVASGGTAAFTQPASPAVVTSQKFSGLSPSTTYYAEVRATNSAGNSPVSNRVAFTTSALVAPNKPASPTVSSITTSTATLTWTAPDTNGSAITGYHWQVVNNANVIQKEGTTAALTVNVTGLVTVSLKARVRANSAAGYSEWSDYKAFALALPPGPGAPAFINLSQLTATGVTVTLGDAEPNTSVISGYQIQVLTSDLGIAFDEESVEQIVPVTGLITGQEYWARGRANSDEGYGPWVDSGVFKPGTVPWINQADTWETLQWLLNHYETWFRTAVWQNVAGIWTDGQGTWIPQDGPWVGFIDEDGEEFTLVSDGITDVGGEEIDLSAFDIYEEGNETFTIVGV